MKFDRKKRGDNLSDFKISLAAARVNAGLSQADVARELHMSKSTIVKWESGKTPIGVPQLRALCDIYNMPSDYIFLPSTPQKVDTIKE